MAARAAVGDRNSKDIPAPRGAWRQGVFHQATNPETMGMSGAWCLAAGHVSPGGLGRFRLAALKLRQAIILLSMASGRFISNYSRVGIRASSPFLFVTGDDRVIHYTGVDDDTGDVVDAQATE
ncbi:hypothetical protein DEO72_LG10g2822 [Vigna unguiculata]|uniref:Uncharacterized protein n=1 Tax=Vigna unguiculata TaxID=3917 RepID=A0A4D6NG98_VIGUN|nr:hypothetical protein DEO72_LG10g2822 [Vigna unguiculata]